MLSQQTKEYLDSLDTELFLSLLAIKFGRNMPIWEECSKEEFEQHTPPKTDIITLEWLDKAFRALFGPTYKAVPFYENHNSGLLFQLEEHEPIGYKYYKQVGKKFVFVLGSDMLDYCYSREDIKDIFKKEE